MKVLGARSTTANAFDSSINFDDRVYDDPPCPEFFNEIKYETPEGENIRHHPAIISIVREVLNPAPADPRDQLGNWGLWNFEGNGPEAGPPDFAVGQVGAVMSLPGCADQTIHADTSHLYVHAQLPAHYINLFLPAVAVDAIKNWRQSSCRTMAIHTHNLLLHECPQSHHRCE